MLAAMDAADTYPTVQRLRAFEAERLALHQHDLLVDVGCGLGTAALALAVAVPGLQVRGVDLSERMTIEATRRAGGMAGVTFEVGDATKLPLGDDSASAYRSERTYQWFEDPGPALGEAMRVVKAGGAISLIDTDWGTFAIDHPDQETTAVILACSGPMSRNRWSGRRLSAMLKERGLVGVQVFSEALSVDRWDPDETPGVPGIAPFDLLKTIAVDTGYLTEQRADTWLTQLAERARRGLFYLTLTMTVAVGRAPG
jgi:SAM-dependent methyltransferase